MSDVTFFPRLLVCILLVLLSPTAYTASHTILVYGDSISAAYGMEEGEGWVQLLAEKVAENNLPFKVVNASVSGETSGGGLVRLPKTLEVHEPKVVILELGGNDGLRGYPIDKIRDNLDAMTAMALARGADVLLIGMVLPPNYGKRYIDAFTNVFPEVAQSNNVGILPFLLDGIATPESLVQRDGIHPKPEAQPLIVNQIWPRLLTLLEKVKLQDRVISGE